MTNKLITELKAELAYQTQRATRLEISERNCDHLQTKVTELENSISVARSEIKTLSTKLAAARNTDMGAKVPGSALKATAGGKQALSTEVVQVAQAKEDLYCDLTGLIIRGMKHGQQENVFDCLQTGRNGSMFPLPVVLEKETNKLTRHRQLFISSWPWMPQMHATITRMFSIHTGRNSIRAEMTT